MLKGAQDHVPEKLDPTDQRGTPSFTELNNEGKYIAISQCPPYRVPLLQIGTSSH